METGQIKKFVDLIKNTDIEELHWEEGDLKVVIKRSEIIEHPLQDSKNGDKTPAKKEDKFLYIKSPMVGTFYRAQSIDHPPLVIEGNHVVPGQKVAVIEAMKIMKDVLSTVKGRIVRVLVENGQPVDFGRDLFQVDPETSTEEKSGGK